MDVLKRLREMQSELDTIITHIEEDEVKRLTDYKVVESHKQLRIGSVVSLVQDYTHTEDESCSLSKGMYEVDYVEDEFYLGILDVTFKGTGIWYSLDLIRKQTQVLLVKV